MDIQKIIVELAKILARKNSAEIRIKEIERKEVAV